MSEAILEYYAGSTCSEGNDLENVSRFLHCVITVIIFMYTYNIRRDINHLMSVVPYKTDLTVYIINIYIHVCICIYIYNIYILLYCIYRCGLCFNTVLYIYCMSNYCCNDNLHVFIICVHNIRTVKYNFI